MLTFGTYAQFDFQARQDQILPLAFRIFDRARGDARQGWIKALFTGRLRMPTLSRRIAGRAIRGQHSLGLRSVEIERIVGSESRGADFDAYFNPRHDRMRVRWVRIAEQQLSQASLPAVELIQVGDEYFVRDGHHRVSVARALGCSFIDAQVIHLELSEPTPSGKNDPAALRYAGSKYDGEID